MCLCVGDVSLLSLVVKFHENLQSEIFGVSFTVEGRQNIQVIYDSPLPY